MCAHRLALISTRFLASTFFTFTGNRSPRAHGEVACRRLRVDRRNLLTLDFKSFDQSPPFGGWRKFQHCPGAVEQLIDAYVVRHGASLLPSERAALTWHSGQMSAMAGDDRAAINKMAESLVESEGEGGSLLWNPYVRGTIAFLRHEKIQLLAERDRIAEGAVQVNRINLRILDALIRCFDQPYAVAYANACP